MAAAEAQMFSWEELKSYVSDIISMYESTDKEYKTLSGLKQLKADIHALTNSAELDVKRLLVDMQNRVARAEAEAMASAPAIEETRTQLLALEEHKARVLEEVTRLRHDKDASQASLHSLTQQIAAIKQAKATLNMDHGANVPRVKHSLSLYASISSIRWDYDSAAAAGYVAPPGGAPVKPFHFDPRVMSEKMTADALWASIGDAYGLPA